MTCERWVTKLRTAAAGVEFVEALTIVLAMGTTRGWRSTWAGVGAALAALAVVTAAAGYALQSWVPEAMLQLVVGTLLLIFGLQWLRKAILRSAGLKTMHDEEETFRDEVEAARSAGDVLVLGVGALLVSAARASDPLVAALTAGGIMLVAIGSIVAAALRAGPR